MRNSCWTITFLLVLECIVLLVEPSECFLSFIPVSVHTALQVLTLLVKIKSIIFKILLGLKLMGVEGFIMKRRRRSIGLSTDENKSALDKIEYLSPSQRTELLAAWDGLEKLLGQRVQFQEQVCIDATALFTKRPLAVWDGVYLQEEPVTRASRQSSIEYSNWVSTILGSAIGSPYACHILENHLNFNKSTNYSNSKEKTILPPSSLVLQTGAFS